MDTINVGQKLRLARPVPRKEIQDFLKARLSEAAKYKILEETSDGFTVKGSMKESFLTTVVKFKARLSVKIDGDVARIGVTGDTSLNWIGWLFVIIGLFTMIFWIVPLILYLLQRKKPIPVFESIMKVMDTEFGAI